MVQIYIYFSKIPNPLHKSHSFYLCKNKKKDFLEKEVFLYNLYYLIDRSLFQLKNKSL